MALATTKHKPALIEFSSEAQETPNANVNFGDTPVHCSCPHCQRSIITFIDHETSWVTWVLAFVVWISLGWMAFWVLPLLWPAFKDVVHHCPQCLNVVERKSRISLPTFKNEVMTVKVGSCAVVLARKYVMIFLGLIVVIGGVYVLRSTVHLQASEGIPKGQASTLTWDDFMYDCGPRTSMAMRHRTQTVRTFEERYRRRTFKWQGEVRQIREGFDVLFLKTKSVVMMRMEPARYPQREIPDIALLFGEERNEEVAELNPGDYAEFEATMVSHGHRGDPEVMVLWHIKTIDRPAGKVPKDANPEDPERERDPLEALLGSFDGKRSGEPWEQVAKSMEGDPNRESPSTLEEAAGDSRRQPEDSNPKPPPEEAEPAEPLEAEAKPKEPPEVDAKPTEPV
jgi:hypothetical protein